MKALFTNINKLFEVEVGSVTVPKILKIENMTREDILAAIKQLKPKKSQELDQIPSYILKV